MRKRFDLSEEFSKVSEPSVKTYQTKVVLWMWLALAVFAFGCFIALLASGPDVGTALLVVAIFIPMAIDSLRRTRAKVVVTESGITVVNYYKTYVKSWDQIDKIELQDRGNTFLLLNDKSSITVYGIMYMNGSVKSARPMVDEINKTIKERQQAHKVVLPEPKKITNSDPDGPQTLEEAAEMERSSRIVRDAMIVGWLPLIVLVGGFIIRDGFPTTPKGYLIILMTLVGGIGSIFFAAFFEKRRRVYRSQMKDPITGQLLIQPRKYGAEMILYFYVFPPVAVAFLMYFMFVGF